MKILKIVSVVIVALLISASVALYFSRPQLPENIDKTIDEVLQSDLHELLKGKTGYVSPDNTMV